MNTARMIAIGLLFALGACGRTSGDNSQTAVVDETAPIDVDTLPPDESVATPSDELANGVVENDTSY